MTKTTVLAPPGLDVAFKPPAVDRSRSETRYCALRLGGDSRCGELQPCASARTQCLRVSPPRKTVTGTSADLSGFDPADYYWNVTAIDAHKKESAPSDAFRFTLIAQGKTDEMLLEVDGTQLHGSVVELMGRNGA